MSVKVSAAETGPILSFPGGVPQNVDELSLSLGEKKRKRQISGSLHGLAFKAQDNGEKDGKSQNVCKYAVAKVNTNTHTVEIMPTQAVFVMRPQVGKGEDFAPARLSGMTPDERRKSLTQEFGSSKKQRAVKQAASNQIQDETVQGATAVEAALQSVGTSADGSQSIVLPDAAEQALEQNRRIILPSYDDKATTAAEAYPRDRLLPSELSDELESFYDTLVPENIGDMKSKLVIPASAESVRNHFINLGAPTVLSECVNALERLHTDQLRSSSSGAEGSGVKKKTINRQFRADMVLVIYLHFLLRFQSVVMAKLNRGNLPKEDFLVAMAAPVAITESLCTKFATMSKRGGKPVVSVPQTNKDRVLCYLLVVGMHASNNHLNVTALAKDMRVNEAFLVKYVRQTGMKLLKKRGGGDNGEGGQDTSPQPHTEAVLDKVPLVFPGPPRKQQGK